MIGLGEPLDTEPMDTELQADSGLHQPGTVVGDRYRITSILGQGGSGITYAAEDLQHNGAVALKALSLKRMQDWKQLELFEREAQVLAKLDHPQIPRYVDHFHVDTERDRSFYIVQALAPGQDLAQRVQKGWRTDEAGVRKIVRQVLGILAYLHQIKPPVVHRDLKPQNLVMGDDGTVYLVDFGAVQETYYNTFMRGSTMVGTFGYMAPEQFRGQAVPQTDLYALGATVLFLLTHRSPAELPQERLRVGFRSHVQVSEAFADWLERCLEPDLEDRMASAKDAADMLQGRFVISNWRRVVPWKMMAGLGAASAVVWSGFDTFKYDLLKLSGLQGINESKSGICQAIRVEDTGTVQEFFLGGKNKALPKERWPSCEYFSEKMMRTILETGLNVNQKDTTGDTLLHWVARSESPKAIKLLLDQGADVSAENILGWTPLHSAVASSAVETTTLLLEKGSDVNAKGRNGDTPLHLAASNNIILLSRRPWDWDGSPGPETPEKLATVKRLLTYGADVNAKNKAGVTPLAYARASGYGETVKLLLDKGADVNARADARDTPLAKSE